MNNPDIYAPVIADLKRRAAAIAECLEILERLAADPVPQAAAAKLVIESLEPIGG